MTSLVSTLIAQTERIPLVGQATTWIPGYKHIADYSRRSSLDSVFDGPPPPYEKVDSMSRFSKLSGYVWKRASFSSTAPAPVKPTICEKDPSNFDKERLEQAITLLSIATEMNHSGNRQMSLDLYMMGIERTLAALPVDTDPTVKTALEKTIVSFKTDRGLELTPPPPLEEAQSAENPNEEKEASSNLSNLVISTAVLGAIILKKSPIPSAVSAILAYAKSSLETVDETCKIRERAWDIASLGVAKAIEIDQRYEIHQMMAEIVCTTCSAILKAGIAYAETPGYKESS
ncbi:hypothetical protein EC973_000037 [Apophysomyces ossiformis]|uniref:Uncharacterized protein n=1 Tax=Apophysomyces ossiformis TaxID=679940 RepID=A0A8H7BWY2_9FUNG|nr:hypothetical protein EC973_000037 [Apophysomyces ossiformis]